VAIKQEANVPLVLTIGIVAGILIIVIIIGLQGWYQSQENDEMAYKADLFKNADLIDLKAAQTDNISHYRWVDKQNNVVSIPIERAMQVMIETNGNPPSTQPATK
jgi:hypothetical protein